MIYKNKVTKSEVRHLGWFIDIATQEEHVLIVDLETGILYGRATDKFNAEFDLVNEDPNSNAERQPVKVEELEDIIADATDDAPEDDEDDED